MSDLVARLRRMSFYEAGPHRWWYKFSHEAADEIVRLRAENEGLRNALEVRNWTEAERDGMSAAFERANARHGHYETLFAVGAWLLRHRASKTEGKG